MVTAILPSLAALTVVEVGSSRVSRRSSSASSSNAVTSLTPDNHNVVSDGKSGKISTPEPSSRLAGVVGLATGVGALLALLIFLRMPAIFQNRGATPAQALKRSYYVVGIYAVCVSFVCFLGLRYLRGEKEKGWRYAFIKFDRRRHSAHSGADLSLASLKMSFKSRSLGLAYLGGLVARASSVAISTFIPLFVNTFYISSGICDATAHDPEYIKVHCREAYVLAAKLTGVSQTAALVFAMAFGFAARSFRGSKFLLIPAALIGCLGYVALAIVNDPSGTPLIFIIMIMLGIRYVS